ncbi:hypothetical protein EYB33_12845 [Lysinibacillus sphaericus]|uniref:hypothetical protein n=1 Tax=Lysinibacillus sphaericus TaxID=1421 RepID=UPI001E2E9D46|nr:hypothetical protein [Lysinibacillus sphaericus]UDK97131.1 hypothetical protein EYB33_12845 [Lysinibacillus sphaericus]
MKKAFKFGCLGVLIGLVVMLFLILVIGGILSDEDSPTQKSTEETSVIIDATQFSRINSAQLIEIMGQPEIIEDYEWLVPKTNKNIVGKLYIYEKNKFEFVLFDDTVSRLNVYSGQFWGYDDSTMEFEKNDDIFHLFGIEPSKQLKKVADTDYALRYKDVSEKIDDMWIQDIKDKTFGIAKFTYDSTYY